VLAHHNSKQIARSLGISSHTVDQRLRQAIRHLGASSRVDAAKRLAALEGWPEYQSLACQTPDIEPAGDPIPQPAPKRQEKADHASSAFEREIGDHESLQRTTWIVAIAAAAVLLLAALIAALNALSEFTR
jgi:hypothetical protein